MTGKIIGYYNEMELTALEKYSVSAGLLEVGEEHSHGQYNNFKRCPNPKCPANYFVNALGRTKLIKCPNCGTVRER